MILRVAGVAPVILTPTLSQLTPVMVPAASTSKKVVDPNVGPVRVSGNEEGSQVHELASSISRYVEVLECQYIEVT